MFLVHKVLVWVRLDRVHVELLRGRALFLFLLGDAYQVKGHGVGIGGWMSHGVVEVALWTWRTVSEWVPLRTYKSHGRAVLVLWVHRVEVELAHLDRAVSELAVSIDK